MASKRLGKQTVMLQNPPRITSTASIVVQKRERDR